MNVVLVMFRENGERRSFSLSRDVTVVGRREDADFRIPLTDVSRKHCRFIKDGAELILEDLGSSNGTFHNGKRVQETEVMPGDFVQIGPVQFLVQIDGEPTDDELDKRRSGGAQETHHDAGLAGSSIMAAPIPPASNRRGPVTDDDVLEVMGEDADLEEISDDDINDDIIDLDDEDDKHK